MSTDGLPPADDASTNPFEDESVDENGLTAAQKRAMLPPDDEDEEEMGNPFAPTHETVQPENVAVDPFTQPVDTEATRKRARALLFPAVRTISHKELPKESVTPDELWTLTEKDGVTADEILLLLRRSTPSNIWFNILYDQLSSRILENGMASSQLLPLLAAVEIFFTAERNDYMEQVQGQMQTVLHALLTREHRVGSYRLPKKEDALLAIEILRQQPTFASDSLKIDAEKRLNSFTEQEPEMAIAFAQACKIDTEKIRAFALDNIGNRTIWEQGRAIDGIHLEYENPDVQAAALDRVEILANRAKITEIQEIEKTFALPPAPFRKAVQDGLMNGLRHSLTLEQFKKAQSDCGFSIDVKDPEVQKSALLAFELIQRRAPDSLNAIRDYFGLDLLADPDTRASALYELGEHIKRGDIQGILTLRDRYQMSNALVEETIEQSIARTYSNHHHVKETADAWCTTLLDSGLITAEQIREAKKQGWLEYIEGNTDTWIKRLVTYAADIGTQGTLICDASETKQYVENWYLRQLDLGDIASIDQLTPYCDFSLITADPSLKKHARKGIRFLLSKSNTPEVNIRQMQSRYSISDEEFNEDTKQALIESYGERYDERATKLADEYGLQDILKGPEAKERRIKGALHYLNWFIDESKHTSRSVQDQVAEHIQHARSYINADGFTDAELEPAIANVLMTHLSHGVREGGREYIKQILQTFDVHNILLSQSIRDAAEQYILTALSQPTFEPAQEMMQLMGVDPLLEKGIAFLPQEEKLSLLLGASSGERVSEFIEQKPFLELIKDDALVVLSSLSLEERRRILPSVFALGENTGRDFEAAFTELTVLLIGAEDPLMALEEIPRIFAEPYPLICKVALVYGALYPGRKITLPLEQYKVPLLESFHTIEPEDRGNYIQLFLRISNSPSDEMKRIQDQLIRLILTTDNPLDAVERIEAVFVRNNIPLVGKIYRVFDMLYPEDILASKITHISSPFLQQSRDKRRRVTIYKDLLKVHVFSANRNLRKFLEILQEGEHLIARLDTPENALSDGERQQAYYALLKFETLFEHTRSGESSVSLPEKRTGSITDEMLRSRYLHLCQTLGVEAGQSLHAKMVQLFASPLGFKTVDDVLNAMSSAKEQAHERGIHRVESGNPLTLEEGDCIKAVKEDFVGFILQNGSVAKEFLGADSGSDYTPLDTDLSMVTKEDAAGGFNGALQNSIGYRNKNYGNILFVLKNRGQYQITDTKTEAYDATKYELFNTPYISKDRHYGIRTGFPSTEIDYMIASGKLHPKDRNNLFFEIAKNGFYIPVTDTEGAVIFTPEMYRHLRLTFDGLDRFDGDALPVSTETTDRHTRDIEQMTEEVMEQRVKTHRQMTHIESITSSVLGDYGASLKSVYDTSLGGVRLEDIGSTGRGTQLSESSDFDFALKLDSSIGDRSIFAKSEEIAEKIVEKLQPATYRIEGAGTGAIQLRTFNCQACDGVDVDIGFIPSSDIIDFGSHTAVAEKLEWIEEHQGTAEHDRVVANIVLAKKLLKEGKAYKKLDKTGKGDGGIGGIGVENWILSHGCNVVTAFRSFLDAAFDANGTIVPLEEFKKRYDALDAGVNVRFGRQGESFFYPLKEQGYQSMISVMSAYLGHKTEQS